MKLAEALALRSDTTRKVAHLRERIVDNARHQEGEVPAEDAAVLLEELTSTLSELERLMRAINRTNAQAILGNGTVTDALAHRDVLRLRHSAVNAAADAASGARRARLRSSTPIRIGLCRGSPRHRTSGNRGRPRPRDSRGRYTDSTNELGGGSDRVSTAALEQVVVRRSEHTPRPAVYPVTSERGGQRTYTLQPCTSYR